MLTWWKASVEVRSAGDRLLAVLLALLPFFRPLNTVCRMEACWFGVKELRTLRAEAPETVNQAPEAEGWFAKVKIADASAYEALMDRAAYDAFLETL